MEPAGYIACACGRNFPLTIANSVVNSYWYQPWFAWVMGVCDNCGAEYKNFFGPKHWREQCERFTEAGIGFIVETGFAPPYIIESFTQVYRKKLRIPTARDTDESDERLIGFFRYLLERGDTQ